MSEALIGGLVLELKGRINEYVTLNDPDEILLKAARDAENIHQYLKAARVACASNFLDTCIYIRENLSLGKFGLVDFLPEHGRDIPTPIERTSAFNLLQLMKSSPDSALGKSRLAFETIRAFSHMTSDYERAMTISVLEGTDEGINFMSIYNKALELTRDNALPDDDSNLYASIWKHLKGGGDTGIAAGFEYSALAVKLGLKAIPELLNPNQIRSILLHKRTRQLVEIEGKAHLRKFSNLKPLMHFRQNRLNGYIDPRFFQLEQDDEGFYIAANTRAHSMLADFVSQKGLYTDDGVTYCAAFYSDLEDGPARNVFKLSYRQSVDSACEFFVPVALLDVSFENSEGNF